MTLTQRLQQSVASCDADARSEAARTPRSAGNSEGTMNSIDTTARDRDSAARNTHARTEAPRHPAASSSNAAHPRASASPDDAYGCVEWFDYEIDMHVSHAPKEARGH